MSRRRFALATVLRVRRVQEDAARGDVRQRQAAHTSIDAELRRLDGRLDSHSTVPPGTAASVQAGIAAGLSLAATAAAVRQRREAAAAEVTSALDGWKAARGRVRALERLEQNHREALAIADARAEAAEVDDLSATQYIRRRREAR